MSLNMKFICARFTEHFLPKTNTSHIDRHDEISSFNYRKSDHGLEYVTCLKTFPTH
jgi:hypothetical protein